MAEYTTRQGDTWESIAWKQLGDSFLMQELMEANRPYFETAMFDSGDVLTLPEVTTTAAKNEATPPWRRTS